MRIDLNADVGESFGAWTLGEDAAVMTAVTSANVACGFHAGDPGTMRRTIDLAVRNGVAIGAHPGLPDLAGFGRRSMDLSPEEVQDLVLYQVSALMGLARAAGVAVQHVKPHGALYNMAWRSGPIAEAIVRATAQAHPSLLLFAPPDSALMVAGRRAGLRCTPEGFVDRAYQPDGSLVARRSPGSVLDDIDVVVARAIHMAREQEVIAVDGSSIPMAVETLCVHGDHPGAARLAARVRASLEASGVRLRAPSTIP